MKNTPAILLMMLMAADMSSILAEAAPPSREERVMSKQWAAEHLGSGNAALPFSFVYNGASSSDLLPQLEGKSDIRELDKARTERTLSWHDRQSGLVVRCVVVEYEDFPAVEWTLYFKNEGSESSPILKDVLGLDMRLAGGAGDEFVLYGTKGDWCTPDSFEPFEKKLAPGTAEQFAPYGGRPTNAAFPYYNLKTPGGGMLLVIGWPGNTTAPKPVPASCRPSGVRIAARKPKPFCFMISPQIQSTK
ncbi:MAG TPA: hypothetical protein PLI09_03190 [Candidatus Hydrogenedentes bacterium]|nr:hypothetical protein [Candidatus Hydrogenedentota bacterium]